MGKLKKCQRGAYGCTCCIVGLAPSSPDDTGEQGESLLMTKAVDVPRGKSGQEGQALNLVHLHPASVVKQAAWPMPHLQILVY